MDDTHYMKMALALAARGMGTTSPNPMVGAVVVHDDEVVGTGWHHRAGGPHAEVHALDTAGDRARGATLYVTLEPCNHTGRTPPCTEWILAAGIARVVSAMPDPNPNVAGGGNAMLTAHGVEVTCGLCRAEAQELNAAFIKHTTTGRPYVVVKCAATLDGRIATRTGDARWITGPEARAHVHRMRHAVDAILVGVRTVIADDPRLTTRLSGDDAASGKDPVRIVVDTHLDTPPDARVLRLDSKAETIIIYADSAPAERARRLERQGVRLVREQTIEGRIDLNALTRRLGAEGITSLLIEGGGRIIASALAAGIVDKALFFYAPKILGGDDGIPICSGPGAERMGDAIGLFRVRTHRFGDVILIEGAIAGGWDPCGGQDTW